MAIHTQFASSSPPFARTRIKMCGLTRESDVDAAVQCGADAIGFVLYPQSPRCVSLERACALAARLPAFVTPVLLSVNASVDQLQAAARAMPAAILQLHGDESPAYCAEVAQKTGRAYIRAARIPVQAQADFDLLEFVRLHPDAQAILLDTLFSGYGGSGKTFNWSQLPTNVNAHLVLSGGLTPANVIDGITTVRPRARSLAVDVSSGIETAKGIKDPLLIQQFIAAVHAADLLQTPHSP
jgi:phosphoribosylanthranilate isomerase